MAFQVCPQHSFEEIDGAWISDEVGREFTCTRTDHVTPGPFSWISAPPPPPGTDLRGIAEELGLGVEIPAVLKQFAGTVGRVRRLRAGVRAGDQRTGPS